jgi:hypothetical protein
MAKIISGPWASYRDAIMALGARRSAAFKRRMLGRRGENWKLAQ